MMCSTGDYGFGISMDGMWAQFSLPTMSVETPATESSPLLQAVNQKQNGLVLGRAVSRVLESIIPHFGKHASLTEAWDYFEETILPRRKVNTYERARGDGTVLYDAWTTPQSALANFGTGVAIYFESLRILAAILLVAYILYLPSIWFYASSIYDPQNASNRWYDIPLRGSLMCRHTHWIPCIDCNSHDFPSDRISVSNNGVSFVLKNDCSPMRFAEGVNHLVVVVFITIAMIGLGFYQKKLELQYDESVLTASDYSIIISNPPKDAVDAEEWKNFLEPHFGKVRYCTIALDNETLINALTTRRALLLQAMYQDDLRQGAGETIAAVSERVRLRAPQLARKCDAAEEKCLKLLKEDKPYSATRVFVTFEYEKSQRNALAALLSRDPMFAFRGNHVLNVTEAMEPSVVRWSDLNETRFVRWAQRGCASLITLFIMYISLQCVWYAFGVSVDVAAITVAMFSAMAHTLFWLLNQMESHAEESSYQASLFCKLMAFRFVNTVVSTMLITPFTETVGEKSTSLIPAIYAVLQAEVIVTPLANIMDPVGHFNRLVLAPFAKNQEAMNSYFKGTLENYGNKYTNMTKIVFLCFFYSTIFPSGLLFGSVALLITYWTDKFLLLRTWAPIPEIGNHVLSLSRRVIFPLCLIVLLLMSELYWSAYPFDNVCENDETVGDSDIASFAIGGHILMTSASNDQAVEVVVNQSDMMYRHCDQNYLEHLSGLLAFFEMETDDWMSDDQQYLTYIFGLVCVGFASVLMLLECKYDAFPIIHSTLFGRFYTTERDSGLKYSDQPGIRAYIPEAPHPLLSFPLLSCDIELVETTRIGWVDRLRPHKYYSLQNDVDYLMGGKSLNHPVLGIVKQWV